MPMRFLAHEMGVQYGKRNQNSDHIEDDHGTFHAFAPFDVSKYRRGDPQEDNDKIIRVEKSLSFFGFIETEIDDEEEQPEQTRPKSQIVKRVGTKQLVQEFLQDACIWLSKRFFEKKSVLGNKTQR